ncbi:MAG TPA: hypothetical protein VKZ18_00130 [Polyangia bacterium]|nr:hypothetical protein [Polyangia bacterium]
MIRVDIYRPEQKGVLSSIACIITITGDPPGGFCHEVTRGEANKSISGGTATVLLGGDRVVCELRPGASIQAFTPRSLRPDGVTPDAGSWAPTALTPRARPGQSVEVGIVPKSRGRSYAGGWLVRQEPHATTAKHGGP